MGAPVQGRPTGGSDDPPVDPGPPGAGKLTLPVLIVASFGLMLLGKADALLAERARMALADGLAPIYAALSRTARRTSARAVTDVDPAVGHARRKCPAAGGKRAAAALAVHRAGAGCREPAAEGQPALDPRSRARRTSPRAWSPMPAASMPRRCCCRSAPTTASARARSRWMNAAWSGASPKWAPAPRACC